jgi:hypothetical protein
LCMGFCEKRSGDGRTRAFLRVQVALRSGLGRFQPRKRVNWPRSGSTSPPPQERSGSTGPDRGQLVEGSRSHPGPSPPSPRLLPCPLCPSRRGPLPSPSHGSTGPDRGQLARAAATPGGSTGRPRPSGLCARVNWLTSLDRRRGSTSPSRLARGPQTFNQTFT